MQIHVLKYLFEARFELNNNPASQEEMGRAQGRLLQNQQRKESQVPVQETSPGAGRKSNPELSRQAEIRQNKLTSARYKTIRQGGTNDTGYK